ncbi:MAG: preprotein translocase subunit YajC [Clostridia bacterium]|nr:preprotein translocase subunit YajC [Clostridia bacterium]
MLNYVLADAAATVANTANASGTAAAGNSWISTLVLVVVMVAVFYFLIIRPQKKRDKQAKDMREAIKVGDEIVTIGGICGKVTNVKDETITIVSAESKMTFLKTAVASVTTPDNE